MCHGMVPGMFRRCDLIAVSTLQPRAPRRRRTLNRDRRPRVVVAGYSPGGPDPLRHWLGGTAEVCREANLGSAIERCLRERVNVLFVNLFRPQASELTALAMFRLARPDQYVAACAEESFLDALEQAGLADALFKLERVENHHSSISS